jgi:hypothetical protein
LQEDDAGPEEHDMFVVDPGVVACLLRQFEEGFRGKFVEGELLLHGSLRRAPQGDSCRANKVGTRRDRASSFVSNFMELC